MSLLRYSNLIPHRPDILMNKVFDGLKPFHQFLETTKKYLESPNAVQCVAWEAIPVEIKDEEQESDQKKGVWVRLIEPDFPVDMDKLVKLFCDESNDEVYEASKKNWQQIGAAAKECPHCKTKQGKPKLSYQTEEHALEMAADSGKDLDVYPCPKDYGWHLTQSLSNDYLKFKSDNKIQILERDIEREMLRLNRLPDEEYLVLRPNTYQIRCQMEAVQRLQNKPTQKLFPLLRLFEANNHAKWENFPIWLDNPEWMVLTDAARSGADEQRLFVKTALNTPDFAILEGPPGSGKTTVICELILQLAKQGKRILLCASTHVAVDNVLERLMTEDNEHRHLIIPVRIGDEGNLSPEVKPYQLKTLMETEKKRLLNGLRDAKPLSEPQKYLQNLLSQGSSFIQRMVLEGANLVCGTTIGILQHPDIKEKGKENPHFDVLIIDEASKTTFQEFLVPATLAERWILVGDPKQLSPYVDDESLAVNLEPCLPNAIMRQVCWDVFSASQPNNKRETLLIATDDHELEQLYLKQAEQRNVFIGHQGNTDILPYADMVIGNRGFLEQQKNRLPLDISLLRNAKDIPDSVVRKHRAYLTQNKQKNQEEKTWQAEIGWRLARHYEQRLNSDDLSDKKSSKTKLKAEVEKLLPADADESEKTWRNIDSVRRVALPSVLELLQEGFERNEKQRVGTALSDGLPEDVLEERLVTLSYQHRMHPDIAEFSHNVIYGGNALFSDGSMAEKQNWSYCQNQPHCSWQDVNGKKDKFNANQNEVQAMMNELKKFAEWAKNNPNSQGKLWEVAILTFYRGQERAVRKSLQKWTNNPKGFRHFKKNDSHMALQVCTVDRFQGHEADLVLLSFANPNPTSFLESPNRLNVAITRARCQLIVFGNRKGLAKSSGVLGQFAAQAKWGQQLNNEEP